MAFYNRIGGRYYSIYGIRIYTSAEANEMAAPAIAPRLPPQRCETAQAPGPVATGLLTTTVLLVLGQGYE